MVLEKLVDGMFKVHLNCRKCITVCKAYAAALQCHFFFLMTNKPEQITAEVVMSSFIDVCCLNHGETTKKEIKPNEVNYEGNSQTDVTGERTDRFCLVTVVKGHMHLKTAESK